MIIVETVLAIGALCTLPKRPSSDHEVLHYLTDGSKYCFQISTGETLERRIANRLQGLDGVGVVTVVRDRDQVQVQVHLSKFDRATRRKVYSIERELFRDLPDLSIGLYLVDESKAPEDAKPV